MAKQWTVRCKDCGEEFGYSDWSNQISAERGQSRPERCPECRKKHNRQIGLMGLSYFNLKPRSNSDTSHLHPGQLGALSHPQREHTAIEIPSGFDPNKFGVTDDDIRAIFDWLSDPKHQVAVVVGPTGSGKSTALPFRLIHPPKGIPEDRFTRYGQILITQPRIQATRNIPAYVAKDLYGSSLGSGFDIGFRYKNNPYSDWRNRLVYATDGTLINWIVDGKIANLSVIMIDEAHERSLNIDLILGLLKKLLPRYPHLKLIVASATIDSGLFINYFGIETAKLIEFKGMRKYNVDTYFFEESEKLPYDNLPKLLRNIPNEVAKKVVWLLDEIANSNKPSGDILAFLQGEKPIEQAVTLIRQAVKGNEKLSNVDVFPLYTTLPQIEQDKALKKKPDPSRRRVVVTTNVAETSLTVEDIVYVVDSGLINEAQWDAVSETKQVVTVRHSQAGCKQRWGRGGRVRDGQAYCLYTESQFNNLFPEFTTPQIQRSDLEPVILAAKAAGIDDLTTFDWIQRPPVEELERAPHALQQIGALDSEGFLTEHGLELQSFGEEPALAHLLAMADQFSCAIEMATLLPIIKLGGLRFLLRTDRNWDATTKRQVEKIHKALKKGCKDDLEYCLKLYTLWSDPHWEGQRLVPIWAFQKVWPRFIPKLPDSIKAILGNKEKEFKLSISKILTKDEINKVANEYELGPDSGVWVKSAEEAILKAEREAWGLAFYINASLFRDKIEPERKLLLESLSGHKKEEERRPINFDLLDKVRILMAYCLTDRIYTKGIRAQDLSSETTDPLNSSYISPAKIKQGDSQNFPLVQINNDSVLIDRRPEAFVCGKQQVIVHPIDPDPTPKPVMHVSYLTELDPTWMELIRNSKHSVISLAKHISLLTAKQKGNCESIIKRLFIDQVFPIGSRYQGEVQDQLVDGKWKFGLDRFVRYPLEVLEGFRGEEPEVVAGADDESNENWDLVDTVLAEEDVLVMDPEEDPIPPWEDLANASAEIQEIGFGALIDWEENEEQPKIREKITYSLWPDGPECQLISSSNQGYKPSERIYAEVVDYLYNTDSPVILLRQVPEREPFVVFIENYKIGNEVEVEVIDYDERPGDFLISLVLREPKSGLEIILEPERISFTTRGFAVKEIPIGTKLNVMVESINQSSHRVFFTYLHQTENHRNLIFQQQRSTNGIYNANAIVKEVSQGRVYFMLDWSDPVHGFIHVVSVAGKGLHKGSAESYSIGEVCKLRVQYSQYDAHVSIDELPEEVSENIEKHNIFSNIRWEEKNLYYHGHMPYSTLQELLSVSPDKKYQRAVYDLYRYSNMLYAFTVIPDWGKKVQETYPMGSIINNAKVTDIVGSGVLVELEAGIKGLLRNTDMTSEVQPGALITVTVLKIDLESQRIALAMGEKYLDKMLVPQTKVPLVIGKKGSVIKNIMEQTGTSIDNSPAENNQVEFLICGDTLYDVQQAKAKIESIIIRPNR
ncbi:MAG: hypothetical protein GYA36_20015 [Veillonellaceae bacterium]|nr:hypothetical protein [Veillonellaceae bacterium]